MYLFPNLSILKAVGLSMLSSAVTVGYIVHDNNSQPLKQIDKKQSDHDDFDKQLMMGWWTQQ